jgi:glycosyltransferase involved in cell wall biosynthesis
MIKYNRIKPEVIESIPTGIDTNLFCSKKYNKGKCREQFHLKKFEIAIGIVAVLRQFKRHDLFIEMAKQLIDKYPEKKLKFLIAGDGPGKETINKLILDNNLSDNVVMLGYVEHVPELLTAMDIFVLSSDSKEGVPQSVMQALFMGKPVVATNSGSTKDLLNSNNFQLVGTDSSLELVKGVSHYIDNDKINVVTTDRCKIFSRFNV